MSQYGGVGDLHLNIGAHVPPQIAVRKLYAHIHLETNGEFNLKENTQSLYLAIKKVYDASGLYRPSCCLLFLSVHPFTGCFHLSVSTTIYESEKDTGANRTKFDSTCDALRCLS